MPPRSWLENFDYSVDCGDFLLYELGRLIEDDRASFDDEEFRRVIEAGIHEHIERRLTIRAAMAEQHRMSGAPPGRTLHEIEDIEAPLGNIPLIVQSYTEYLFKRLEECSESAPDERITTAADMLLESPDDRANAEVSIDLLGSMRSAVSARILAYVISAPMLSEDLEMKAYNYVREMWPLPRHYILYCLKPHTHEDIPFLWFQLLIDCDEPSGVDRILEELVVHGANADYREDLLALLPLLEQAHDPDTEDKVLQVLNSPGTPRTATALLEGFLKSTKAPRRKGTKEPWASLERIYRANQRYLAASRQFDAGKKSEAARTLDDLLKEEPHYPLALMLKRLL